MVYLKKGGISLHIIHSLEPLNTVTIQHSGVPPFMNQLAEHFAGHACGGILNLYVGYDEHTIDEGLRDYTTFQTHQSKYPHYDVAGNFHPGHCNVHGYR
jgi:hypothetical protein